MESNLEAGRALDALIATKVFNACPHPAKQRQKGVCRACGAKPPWVDNNLEGYSCPRYSTDIAEAFDVIAHVQKEYGFRFDLLAHEKGYWHAEFFGHPDPQLNSGQRWGDVYASAPALAICGAALQAVETWKASTEGASSPA